MKKGFTIIETMLVLSISALFAVGLMIGWSVNINRQRYEDAVNTFKSDIQDVFNEVENPKNASGRVRCVDDDKRRMLNTAIDTSNSSSNSHRGMTDCIIIGKAILLGNNGVEGGLRQHSYDFKIYTLVWSSEKDISKINNHIDAIAQGSVSIDFSSEETKNLSWGTNIKMVTDNRNDRIDGFYKGQTLNSIFILRSPIDGSIITFGSNAVSNNKYTLDNLKRSRHNVISPGIKESSILNNTDKTFNVCIRNTNSSNVLGGEAVYGRNKIVKIGRSASSVEVAPLDGGSASSCGNGGGWEDVIIDGRSMLQ